MTDDPKRLLEPDGDATDAERELLRSAGDIEPREGAQAGMWAALATRLPPGGTPPPLGGAGTGVTTAGGVSAAKIAGLVAIAALLVSGGAVVATRPTSPSSVPAPVTPAASPAAPLLPSAATALPIAPPAPSPAASSATMEEEPAAPPPASAVAAPPPQRLPAQRAPVDPASTNVAPSPVDALREESALVATARAALRRGDGAAALSALETARARYPRGVLLQEREVLAIEALAQTGDGAGASRRASAFLRAFPTSPHVSHVRSFVR